MLVICARLCNSFPNLPNSSFLERADLVATPIMTSPAEQARALNPAAVHAAYSLIQPHIHRTPLLTCTTLDTIASTPQTLEALVGTPYEGQTPARPRFRLFFKCENFQRIGAFKARGAFHALLRLIEERGEEEVRRRGVITHSSGMPWISAYLRPQSLPYMYKCVRCCAKMV